MKVSPKNSKFFKFILTLVLVYSGMIYAEWYESFTPMAGNIAISDLNGVQNIPHSFFVIFSNGDTGTSIGNYMITVDLTTMESRGWKIVDDYLYHPVVLPDPDSGWNIYYNLSEDNLLGKLHIKANGEFGDNKLLPYSYNGENIINFGVEKRGEVWFIADKIYMLDIYTDSITRFDYPQGWDPESGYKYIYPTDDLKTLFIVSKSSISGDYQIMMFDLVNRVSRLLLCPDLDLLKNLYDIKEWKGHDGYFLILRNNQIWTYNSISYSFQLFIDGFETSTVRIMQDDSGKYLYLFDKSDFYYAGPDFFVWNLDDKTFEKHTFPLDENWGFSYIGPYGDSSNDPYQYDRTRNRIIAQLESKDLEYEYVLIDLKDFSMKYVPDDLFPIAQGYADNQIILFEKNKIINIKKNISLWIFDLSTWEARRTLPFGYDIEEWSVMKGVSGPDILPNKAGSNICHLLPPARREISNLFPNSII
jgi:hypothetical protein